MELERRSRKPELGRREYPFSEMMELTSQFSTTPVFFAMARVKPFG
jgi:hypothetical protein